MRVALKIVWSGITKIMFALIVIFIIGYTLNLRGVVCIG